MVTLIMCMKIFFARLIDVSLGTFRTINTVKGKDLVAASIGLAEITVWFLIVKEALNTDNNSIWIVIAYALGFSVGTYIGGKISKKFIKSNLEVQVILSSKDDNIVNKIKEMIKKTKTIAKIIKNNENENVDNKKFIQFYKC